MQYVSAVIAGLLLGKIMADLQRNSEKNKKKLELLYNSLLCKGLKEVLFFFQYIKS